MKEAYKNVKFYEGFAELQNQAREAVQNETRIMNRTDEYMTHIGKSKGESEREIKQNNMRSFGSVSSANIPNGGKTVVLAQSEIKRRPSIYDDYPKQERKRNHQLAKGSSINLKKLAVAASLTLALAAGGAYLGAVTKAQNDSFERATEIVNIVDAGDYHPQLEGYELIEYGNGSYSFKNSEGLVFDTFGEGENTITAEEIGNLVEQAEQNKQR